MSQVTMIVRTARVKRGDSVVEQVPDAENPFRQTVISEIVNGEIFYNGQWINVKYLVGWDTRTQRQVRYTGTEFVTWQIVRDQ